MRLSSVLHATKISQKVIRKLEGARAAKVTAIFHRSLLIELEDHFLIHLGSQELHATPRSILLSDSDFSGHVRPLARRGQSLRFIEGSIHWPENKLVISADIAKRFESRLRLGGNLSAPAQIADHLVQALQLIPLVPRSAENFPPSPLQNFTLTHIFWINGLSEKRDGNLNKSIPQGQASLGMREALWERIEIFLDSSHRLAWEDMSRSARQIIGLGPGLTPSGDDFLAGFLLATNILAKEWRDGEDLVRKISQIILRESKGRTTPVSMAMLEDAVQGEMSEPMKSFLEVVLLARDLQGIHDLMEEILSIGASSGEDQLNGVATGIFFSQFMASAQGSGNRAIFWNDD